MRPSSRATGSRPSGSRGRHRQERLHQRHGGLRLRGEKTAAFYDSQKRLATEHAVFDDIGRGEPVREAGNGQGMLLSSFTLLRLGASLQAANDPAKRALLEQEGGTGAEDRHAEVSESRDGPGGLQEAIDRRPGRTGQGAGGVGQMKRFARFCAAPARLRRIRARCRGACGLLGAAQARPQRGGARPASTASTRSADAYDRAEGFWGLEAVGAGQ